jgi:DNA-directed RNA polymerase specialized sigma subunit
MKTTNFSSFFLTKNIIYDMIHHNTFKGIIMEEDLIIKYFKGENELKDKILNNYKELIINIATNYICTNIELDDLITEGYIALYNALDKYQ